jgi:hypothetical protein
MLQEQMTITKEAIKEAVSTAIKEKLPFVLLYRFFLSNAITAIPWQAARVSVVCQAC